MQSGITGTRKQEAQGVAGEHKAMNPVKRCITSGSPERQNQKGTHTHSHTQTHTQDYFKELAYAIVYLADLKSAGQAGRG